MHRLARLAWIAAGYLLASVASGIAVALALRSPGLAGVVTLMIAVYALAPALVAILVGEIKPIRHLGYYVVVGTIIGVGLPVVTLRAGDFFLPAAGLCFGPVAGWIYWRIAGRHAGCWKRIES